MCVLKDVLIQVVARWACGRIGRRRKSVATFRLRVVVHGRAQYGEKCFMTVVESDRVVAML
jgi:hypothetical protein